MRADARNIHKRKAQSSTPAAARICPLFFLSTILCEEKSVDRWKSLSFFSLATMSRAGYATYPFAISPAAINLFLSIIARFRLAEVRGPYFWLQYVRNDPSVMFILVKACFTLSASFHEYNLAIMSRGPRLSPSFFWPRWQRCGLTFRQRGSPHYRGSPHSRMRISRKFYFAVRIFFCLYLCCFSFLLNATFTGGLIIQRGVTLTPSGVSETHFRGFYGGFFKYI